MEADPSSQLTAPRPALSHLRSVLSLFLAMLAGGVLRIWMLRKFFEVNGDSELYGDMAKNLLLHGRYALTGAGGALYSTLIRLPGYPLFLAACFRVFGVENYYAAACLQILLDLAGCALLALFVYRVCPPQAKLRAAHATLWLAVLCPFTAIYAVEPLTESLTVFTIALGLWAVAGFQDKPDWFSGLAFTAAVAYAALLRPDGVLVGVALAPCLLLTAFCAGADDAGAPSLRPSQQQERADSSARVGDLRGLLNRRPASPQRIAIVCLLLALAPFAVWTARNWRVFHVVQPLAPRYATDPGEETWPGWQRWMKTWCLDFVSTYDIYWNLPGAPIDLKKLPARAFDTPAQYADTAALVQAYEKNGEELSPAIDDGFARLAAERIAARPLRYHVWLPVGRVLDMWFRPRIENLPIDLDWWVYARHRAETRFSWAYAGLNALYVALGIAGLCMRPRMWKWMLAYMVLRSILLATLEAPEARYTIECFPMIFALGGIALERMSASWISVDARP